MVGSPGMDSDGWIGIISVVVVKNGVRSKSWFGWKIATNGLASPGKNRVGLSRESHFTASSS